MAIVREYLDLDMEDIIMDAIITRKDGESIDDCKARRKKWEKVKEENGWLLQNHINNQSLPCALAVAGITLRDVYDHLNIACPFPNKYIEELIEYCEKSDEKQRKVIYTIFYDISVDWWKAETININSPKQKLKEAIGRRMERGKVSNRTARLFRPYSMKHSPNDCALVGISVHWLYGLNNMTFFSEAPLVDKIIDAFCFVPDKDQEGLLAFAKEYGY